MDEREYSHRRAADDENGNGWPHKRVVSELPWFSLMRFRLADLVVIGMVVVNLGSAYYRLSALEQRIARLEGDVKDRVIELQRKDAAASDARLVQQQLEEITRRLDRIESNQGPVPRKRSSLVVPKKVPKDYAMTEP